MEDKKRRMIRRYFLTPPWALMATISIAALLFSPLKLYLNMMLAGIIIAAIILYKASTDMPKDAQIDEWTVEDINNTCPRSFLKCSTDPPEQIRDPIIIIGPRFHDLGGAKLAIRRGNDQKVRYNPIDLTIINFAEDYLTAYQCALDLTTGKALNESTDEYFYRDVVSIATETDSPTAEKKSFIQKIRGVFRLATSALESGKLQREHGEKLALATAGGSSVEIFLRPETILQATGEPANRGRTIEDAVRAIRKMLREKKAA